MGVFNHSYHEEIQSVCTHSCTQVWEGIGITLYSNKAQAIDWSYRYHGVFFDFKNFLSISMLPPIYACYDVSPPPEYAFLNGDPVKTYFGRSAVQKRFSDGLILIREVVSNNLYAVTHKGLYIWLSTNSSDNIRHPSRIIREKLIISQLIKGATKIHGGIGFISNEGYLILGPKGAGKTSTIFQLILAGEKSFTANDRLVLKQEKNNTKALGIPISIRLGKDIIDWFPELIPFVSNYEEISTFNLHYQSTVHKPAIFEFTPQEISQLLQLKIVSQVSVKGVLVPNLRRECPYIRIEEVPQSSRLSILTSCVYNIDPAFPDIFSIKPYTFSDCNLQTHILKKPWYSIEASFDDKRLFGYIKEGLS